MNVRALLLVVILVLQSGPVTAGPSAHDGRHDFDFQFGSWSVHVQRRLHPSSGPATWVAYDGTHVVTTVWGGQANLGVLEIAGPAGHIEGQSLRLYSPQSHQWSFTFAESSAGVMGSPMTGAFEAGRGAFYGEDTMNGRSVFVRSLTTRIAAASYRDEYAFSSDGGRTWETNWIATFTRANGAQPLAAVPPFASRDSQQHAFDFEWGAWKAHLVRRLRPLTGSNSWVSYDGPSVVRKVWNGRANLGEIDLAGPAGRIVGLSLRLYDPKARQWNVSFSALGDGTLGSPTIGSFANGRGEFYDQETFRGRAIFDRFVFSAITKTRFRFEQAFSPDGGRTWEPNWIATFTRA